MSQSQINLAWNVSTDTVGVAGYKIFRGSTQIATTQSLSYSDTGLAATTTYTYAVSAFDATGNVSTQSPAVSATTPGPDLITSPLRAPALKPELLHRR